MFVDVVEKIDIVTDFDMNTPLPNEWKFGLLKCGRVYESCLTIHQLRCVLVNETDHPHVTVSARGDNVLVICVTAMQPGKLRANIQLKLELEDGTVRNWPVLNVHATIMGLRQGTPQLKQHVKCVGHIPNYDSDGEETDWR